MRLADTLEPRKAQDEIAEFAAEVERRGTCQRL